MHKADVTKCNAGGGKAFARRFANYVLDAYGLTDTHMQPGRVSLVGRRAFRSHPRQPAELAIARRVVNEDECVRGGIGDYKLRTCAHASVSLS